MPKCKKHGIELAVKKKSWFIDSFLEHRYEL